MYVIGIQGLVISFQVTDCNFVDVVICSLQCVLVGCGISHGVRFCGQGYMAHDLPEVFLLCLPSFLEPSA